MNEPISADVLQKMITVTGTDIEGLSRERPVLLVFLRHFGCTFCREALSDLSKHRLQIEQLGGTLVLVHMSDRETAEKYFTKYTLNGVLHVSDPACAFYQAFGLAKGTARQLFGLHSWIRGFRAGVVDGHGVGTRSMGDGFQMPGVFVVRNGLIARRFVHEFAGDRPEYVSLLASYYEQAAEQTSPEPGPF